MKIACARLKGVCLILLGLSAGGGVSFAAEATTLSFITNTDGSSATANPATPKADASPFKDESASAAADAASSEPGGSKSNSPCYGDAIPCDTDCFVGAPGRFWFRGEYLHWWTNGGHLPSMVSTVTDLTNPNGSLMTVFGNRDVGDDSHEGYRVDLGMWLDCAHHWGIEGDYFDVTGKADSYDSGLSNGFANGASYPIVRPFFDPGLDPNNPRNPIGIQLNGVAYPNQYVGRVTVDTGNYFQSAGLWLRRQVRACEWSKNCDECNWTDASARTFRLDVIGGYRFTRMIDFVDARDTEMDINSASASFLSQYSFVDSYRAVNNFNGAELGLNAVFTHGRWSWDVVCKAAIGGNNQYVRLYGLAAVDPSNTGGTPQQSTSTQEYTRNRFSAIPELTVTTGYQLTDHVKITVGYDLLYWSAVVRAADQIAVEPTTGLPYGTLIGSTLPAFSWNESHLLAQGLRLGGEIRF